MIRIPFTPPSPAELDAILARLPAPTQDTDPTYQPPNTHASLASARKGHEHLIRDLNLYAVHRNDPRSLELKRRLERALVLEDAALFPNPHTHPSLAHPQAAYYLGAKSEHYARACRVIQVVRSVQARYQLPSSLTVLLWEAAGELVPLFLHFGMFIPTVQNLGTKAQRETWLPRALDMEIIGCYAQTEMAHGSNVQGIGTTATYDEKRDVFVLHTPSLEAAKAWPGALGHTANYALVLAQTLVKGKNLGVFPFMLQIRDLKTHEPMPGVSLMDLGPKIGFNVMDNGIMTLDHVAVPRDHLFSGSVQVARGGAVTASADASQAQALVYKTMLNMRAGIVVGACQALWRGTTIGTRYSTVRTQFGSDAQGKEFPILEYQTQQRKVLEPLAASFAFMFAGRMMEDLVANVASPADLKRAHLVSSCLKVAVTHETSAMLEDLRRSAGGHGYAKSSGLVDLVNTYVQMITVEGENSVLAFQVARAASANPASLFTNAVPSTQPTITDWSDLESVAQLLDYTALRATKRHVTSGPGSTIAAEHLVMAAGYAMVLRAFASHLRSAPAHIRATVLAPSAVIMAVRAVLASHAPVADDDAMYAAQAKALAQLRAVAVPATDAFGLTERELVSALGRKDGDVYNAIVAWAKEWEGMNQCKVHPAWLSHILPVTGSKIKLAKL
ncbi:acyl-coenzyme A oxidase [Allomyces javanicus]|nr:acyl-coenzyme A oxidase [Allomyces javanicus]